MAFEAQAIRGQFSTGPDFGGIKAGWQRVKRAFSPAENLQAAPMEEMIAPEQPLPMTAYEAVLPTLEGIYGAPVKAKGHINKVGRAWADTMARDVQHHLQQTLQTDEVTFEQFSGALKEIYRDAKADALTGIAKGTDAWQAAKDKLDGLRRVMTSARYSYDTGRYYGATASNVEEVIDTPVAPVVQHERRRFLPSLDLSRFSRGEMTGAALIALGVAAFAPSVMARFSHQDVDLSATNQSHTLALTERYMPPLPVETNIEIPAAAVPFDLGQQGFLRFTNEKGEKVKSDYVISEVVDYEGFSGVIEPKHINDVIVLRVPVQNADGSLAGHALVYAGHSEFRGVPGPFSGVKNLDNTDGVTFEVETAEGVKQGAFGGTRLLTLNDIQPDILGGHLEVGHAYTLTCNRWDIETYEWELTALNDIDSGGPAQESQRSVVESVPKKPAQTSRVIFSADRAGRQTHLSHGFDVSRNPLRGNVDIIARNRALAARQAARRS